MLRFLFRLLTERRRATVWLLPVLLATATPVAATTYVVFRYDDLAADKPGSRSYDQARQILWEAEQGQDRIFAKFGMPYLVAVVPNMATGIRTNVVALAEDPEKVAFLKQAIAAGRMQVALHGYTHWDYSAANVRRGEFRHANGQQQYEDIAAGRKIITETLGLQQLTTFVPPFNGWSPQTASALVRNGFEILSADRQWYAPWDAPLVHLPFTAQLWELEGLLDQGGLPKDGVVVVLYHPVQIVRTAGSEMRYYGLDKMDALLGRLARLPDVRVVTLDQLRATGLDFSLARYNAAVTTGRLQSAWSQLLPARLLPGMKDQFLFLSEGEYRGINLTWYGITGVAAIGLLIVGWGLCSLFFRLLPPTWVRLCSAGALLALGASAWLLVEINSRGFHPTSIRFFPPWLLIGWLLAAFGYELKRRRQAPPHLSPA